MVGKCKLCGQQINNKRGAHCHLMIKHGAEYERAGRKQQKFIEWETDLEAAGKTGSENKKDPAREIWKTLKSKPRGIRHLNLASPEERAASREIDKEFGEHYEYIDADGNCYCPAELIKRGWL